MRRAAKRLLKLLWDFFSCSCSGSKVSAIHSEEMDLKQAAVPVAFPLSSLQQLSDETLYGTFHFPFLKSSVPLAACKNSSSSRDRPKLLVCHDMKGGYQDDKFVQGNNNGTAYSLWHWQCIDIFVYFSHSLVTIPPPCWTNAAHLHGVQVLGTFITEWDDGAENCKVLLASKESAATYASRLAELASQLGFDGWLLNIENKIEVEQIDTLIYFIKELTAKMHELVPGSIVIWYDAVTTKGQLDWQDSLTKLNKPFFDVCDGIFINYTWQKDYPKKSAKVAGSRASDVYMGVDVFGRNTYGGGGYQSDVALQVALDAGVSAALFAPGWVYETKQGPTFEDAQNRFWASIHSTWPVAQHRAVKLPLFTDFSQGFGRATYVDSEEVSGHSWSNISCQGLQPLMKADATFQVSVRSEDQIYSGGSSLRFHGELEKGEVCIAELFYLNAPVTCNGPLTTKFSASCEPGCNFTLVLRMVNTAEGTTSFIFLESSDSGNEVPVMLIKRKAAAQFSNIKLLETPRVAGEGTSSSLWLQSYFSFEVEEGSSLTLIYGLSYLDDALDYEKATQLMIQGEPATDRLHRKLLRESTGMKKAYQVHLGHLRITNPSCDRQRANELVSFTADNIKWSRNSSNNEHRVLSLKLLWKFEDETSFSRYSLYAVQESAGTEAAGEAKYLGVAFVPAFYLDSMVIEAGTTGIKFILQPQTLSGQQLKNAGELSVQAPDES